MSGILYLAESDRREAWKKYRHFIEDMTREQLRIALIQLLDGEDLEGAMDLAMAYKIK